MWSCWRGVSSAVGRIRLCTILVSAIFISVMFVLTVVLGWLAPAGPFWSLTGLDGVFGRVVVLLLRSASGAIFAGIFATMFVTFAGDVVALRRLHWGSGFVAIVGCHGAFGCFGYEFCRRRLFGIVAVDGGRGGE